MSASIHGFSSMLQPSSHEVKSSPGNCAKPAT